MSTSSVKTIIQDTIGTIEPIGINKLKPIVPIEKDEPRQSRREVDRMLYECKDLIDPHYVKYFAKRFYDVTFDSVMQCASQARQDGKTPQRLFTFLISKL